MRVPWLIRTNAGTLIRRNSGELAWLHKRDEPVPAYITELGDSLVTYWFGIAVMASGEVLDLRGYGVPEIAATACAISISCLVICANTEIIVYRHGNYPHYQRIPVSLSRVYRTYCDTIEGRVSNVFETLDASKTSDTFETSDVRITLLWSPDEWHMKALEGRVVELPRTSTGIIDIDDEYLLIRDENGKYNVCEKVGSRLVLLAEDIYYDAGPHYGKRAIC